MCFDRNVARSLRHAGTAHKSTIYRIYMSTICMAPLLQGYIYIQVYIYICGYTASTSSCAALHRGISLSLSYIYIVYIYLYQLYAHMGAARWVYLVPRKREGERETTCTTHVHRTCTYTCTILYIHIYIYSLCNTEQTRFFFWCVYSVWTVDRGVRAVCARVCVRVRDTARHAPPSSPSPPYLLTHSLTQPRTNTHGRGE